MWESTLRRHHAGNSFNSVEINRMAIRYPVSAAIIDLSIRKALETSTPGQAAFKKAVTMNRLPDAHQRRSKAKEQGND